MNPQRPRFRARAIRSVKGIAAGVLVTTICLQPVQLLASSPAEAAWTGDDTATAVGGLGDVLEKGAELLGESAVAAFMPYDIMFAAVVPLISIFTGSDGDDDPTNAELQTQLNDIQSQLDQIDNQLTLEQDRLATVQATLNALVEEVSQNECSQQLTAVSTLAADVATIQETYNALVSQLADAESVSDFALVKTRFDGWVESVLGTAITDDEGTAVDGSTGAAGIASVIEATYTALVPIADPSQGAIGSCATWYYNAAIADKTWMDDRTYYAPLNAALSSWIQIESSAQSLVQQAAQYRAAEYFLQDGGELAADEFTTLCGVASGLSNAATMCANAYQFTVTDFREQLVTQWTTAGAPLSDDNVVLVFDSAMMAGSVAAGTPTVDAPLLWVRDPAQYPGGTSGPFTQSMLSNSSYDGFDGFAPATAQNWSDFQNAYVGTGESVPAVTVGPPLSPGGVVTPGATFSERDLLKAMSSLTQPDGGAAFGAMPQLVWIPGSTVTVSPSFGSSSQQNQTSGGGTFESLMSSGANATPVTVKCMVITQSGYICADNAKSWFNTYSLATYDFLSSSPWDDNYTGLGTWTVVPPTSPAELDGYSQFSITGTGPGCSSDVLPCVIPVNSVNGAPAVPAWVGDYTDSEGQVWPSSPANATLWPVTEVPGGCSATWSDGGVAPTLCGAALTDYINTLVPDPTVPSPIPIGPAAIADGSADGVVTCTVPGWEAQPDGLGEVTPTGVVWSAASASTGQSTSTTTTYGEPLAITDLIGTDADPSSFSLTCTVMAVFSGQPEGISYTASPLTVVSLTDGVWAVDGTSTPVASIAEDLASITDVLDGDDLTLTATASATQSVTAVWQQATPGSGDWSPVTPDSSTTVRSSPAAATVSARAEGTIAGARMARSVALPATEPVLLTTATLTMSPVTLRHHGMRIRVVFQNVNGQVVSSETVLRVSGRASGTGTGEAGALAATGNSPATWLEVWLSSILIAAGVTALLARARSTRRHRGHPRP